VRVGRGAALVASVVLAVPLLAGCADTVSPVLGGLRLGVRSGSFRVPVMQNQQSPFDYPDQAWQARIGGETRLRIHIDTDGTVDSAYVVTSSGYPVLDSAALAGARRLRYRPARQGDRPVAVWAVLPVRYPLPEEVHEP
jgi:TonB family protein